MAGGLELQLKKIQNTQTTRPDYAVIFAICQLNIDCWYGFEQQSHYIHTHIYALYDT